MTDTDYIAYYDQHRRPEYDDRKLFAMLCPRGITGALSWLTILKRIPDYHLLACRFDPVKLIEFDEWQIEQLLKDSRIIRNRLKVLAIIQNARAFLALQQQGISFSEWIWQFVGGKPIVNQWQQRAEVPYPRHRRRRCLRH